MPITGHTRLVGIFGYPIEHTLSPAMHNAAFAHLGLDYAYLPFEVRPDQLERALHALPALQIVGVNLTIPHKEQALNYLDGIDPQAELIGAVNTIKVEGEHLIGYNTDGQGFVQALRLKAGIEPEGKRVCLLGAGGAARAVAVALATTKIQQLAILNRTLARAQALADHLARHFPQLRVSAAPLTEQGIISQSQIIINTTSVGMQVSDDLLIDSQLIPPTAFVFDLVYHPAQSKLLAAAIQRGARVMNGLGMLLYQGALTFEIWTGVKAPVEVMREALICHCEEA